MIVEFLIREMNATPILIPHVLGPLDDFNDRIIAKEIVSGINAHYDVGIIKDEYSTSELRGIIGQCDFFISMRLHPLIHALSMGVPSIGVDYNLKMKGLMRILGLEECVLDVKNLNYKELKTKIQDAYPKRKEIRMIMKKEIDAIRERAAYNAELVKAHLIKSRVRM